MKIDHRMTVHDSEGNDLRCGMLSHSVRFQASGRVSLCMVLSALGTWELFNKKNVFKKYGNECSTAK